MEFDKALYWKNRKANKRGQGEPFNPIGNQVEVGGKPVSKKAYLGNTKRARKAALNI